MYLISEHSWGRTKAINAAVLVELSIRQTEDKGEWTTILEYRCRGLNYAGWLLAYPGKNAIPAQIALRLIVQHLVDRNGKIIRVSGQGENIWVTCT